MAGFQQALQNSMGVRQQPAPVPPSPTMMHSDVGVLQSVKQGQLQAAKEYFAKYGKLPPGVPDDIAAQLQPEQGQVSGSYADDKPGLVKQVLKNLQVQDQK